MNRARENHLQEIKQRFLDRVDLKYRKGAKEHKESLTTKTDLLEEALDEVVDLFVYILTEIDRKKR